MTFHGVKEAGIADDAVAKAKGLGRFLFDEHSLPFHTAPEVKAPAGFLRNRLAGTTQDGFFQPNFFGKHILGMQAIGDYQPVMRMPENRAFKLDGKVVQPSGASFMPAAMGYGKGFGNWAKNVGHVVGEGLRENVFGSPLALDRQFRDKGYLGMARDFYMPRGNPLGTALGLIGPAMNAASIARQGRANLGRNVGGMVAGLAAAPLTSRLGIPGAVLVQQPIQQLGQWVGSKFDPKVPQQPVQQQAQQPLPQMFPPKTADLKGSVIEAAKQNPVTSLLLAGAAIHGGRKILSKTPAPTGEPLPRLDYSPQRNPE